MAYQANIPQAADLISNSQADILGNFQAINTYVNVNHVAFGLADQGKHKWVTFPVQGTAPVFVGTDDGLYSKVPAAPFPLTTLAEMFIHKQTSAGTSDIPFTASVLSTASPGNGTSGWTYLPSGVILKWGYNLNQAIFTETATAFPVAVNIPVFTSCFTVMLTAFNVLPTTSLYVMNLTTVTATNFTATATCSTSLASGPVYFNYLAIGY